MKTFIVLNGTEASVVKALDIASAERKGLELVNLKPKDNFLVREITNVESLKMHLEIIQ
jgi:hypothetical protein